ncbi:hypothetical protein [Flavicella sediminum]|uniref:hypothetical protein n=1 Tax=Flavicella sediminum TaxID=2585141 RepID=UPI001123D90B|nr:hypothetical protein [Flavicella sediminum]
MDKNENKYLENLKNRGLENPGFSVPENYFEDADDALMLPLFEQKIPKKLAYQVPENYFENFEQELFKKQGLQKKGKLRKLYIASSIAASLLLFFTWNYVSNTKPEVTFESLTIAEIDAYIENGNFYVDSYDIAKNLPEDATLSLVNKTKFSESEILNYLEEVDPELLYLDNL